MIAWGTALNSLGEPDQQIFCVLGLIVISSLVRLEATVLIFRVLSVYSFLLLSVRGVWSEAAALSQTVSLSGHSSILIILLLVRTFACLLVIPVIEQGRNTYLILCLIFITVFSAKFFSATSNVTLFINFELSLIPIFLIILGWGYQTERLLAGKALFIYTAVGSVPLLILIIYHLSFGGRALITNYWALRNITLRVMFLPLVAFLVKLPLMGLHIWLPKAHVDAPVIGSMFLAAILLKLGGWGIIIYQGSFDGVALSAFCVALSILGVVWVSVICCQTLDRKTLIAFSSVIHIGFVVIGVVGGTNLSGDCALAVLLRHGFSSSLAFYVVFLFYKLHNRRRLVLTKTLGSSRGVLRLLWLITVIAVVGCPPAFNLWVEMICYIVFLLNTSALIKPIFFGALTAGVYGFLLLGKIYSGSDFLFKSSSSPNQLELGKGLLGATLTVLSSVAIIIIVSL